MKKTARVISIALLVSFMVVSVGAAESFYGSTAAKTDSSLSIENMLLYAAQDEYLTRGEYAAIMGMFGAVRPFSNISKAEEQHLSLLKSAFSTYKLSFPADGSAQYLQIPATLAGAYKAGVQAEVDNIAMYDKFLASPRIQEAQYADLRTLFTTLRNASSNHLRAFQKQVARY
jgi:hypothetical protein